MHFLPCKKKAASESHLPCFPAHPPFLRDITCLAASYNLDCKLQTHISSAAYPRSTNFKCKMTSKEVFSTVIPAGRDACLLQQTKQNCQNECINTAKGVPRFYVPGNSPCLGKKHLQVGPVQTGNKSQSLYLSPLSQTRTQMHVICKERQKRKNNPGVLTVKSGPTLSQLGPMHKGNPLLG